MRAFRRHLATGQFLVTFLALAACGNGDDHTDVCVGPGCPSYDGIAGENSFLGNGGSSGNGTTGEGGNAGMPEGGADPQPDGGTPEEVCEVLFVSPAGVDADSVTLGGSDDVDSEACGATFTINVTLGSNASTVNLFVNENPIGVQAITGGAVVFEAVLGNRGNAPNVLRAEAAMADGTTCSVTLGGDVFVDCAGPSCSIGSPVANTDGFLSAAQDDDDAAGLQTNVVVNTEIEHVGRTVRLEIDDVFDVVPGADVEANGSDGSATFTAVTLDEGVRNVRAECRDAEGVTTLSPVVEWDVDITPCTTTLVVAANANPIAASDDEDILLADLQVPVTGQTSGNCESVRVGVCGGLSGGFTALAVDGSFSLETTISDDTGSVQVCAEVLDEASNLGTQSATVNVDGAVPTLTIGSPLDSAILTSGTPDCAPGTPGLQVEVTGTSDAAAGSPVQVTIGLGATASTTVSGSATYAACVEARHGASQTLTATVSDTLTGFGNSASITVSVDTLPPGSIAAPTFQVTNRRLGTLDLTWTSVLDTGGAPFAAYRLRCATTDITTEVDWTAATEIPVALTPASSAGVAQTLGLTGFRTGTTRFCVVRGEDANGQLSPLAPGVSATVTNPFLTQEYAVADDSNTTTTINTVTVEPLGDINGDGIDDFATGVVNSTAGGTARIFFGDSDLDANLVDVNAPSLTITRTVNTTSGFGGEVSGLGDVSGDGVPDFAVSARAPTFNTVYVFFGRATNDWPVTIDVSAGCPASLCVVGSAVPTNGGLFAWDVHAADFDGSGLNDLVISARVANGPAPGAGQVYVLLGGAQLAAGGTLTIPANAVATTGEADGFIIDPPASRAHFGVSVTAVDDTGPDDLIIGANGLPPVGPAGAVGAVFFLAGRAYTAGAGGGLVAISSSELLEVDSGTTANYGNPVRALDFNGDGAGDFVVGHDFGAEGAARVFLRNGIGGAFSNSAPFVLNFDGDLLDDNYGLYIANGQHTGLRRVVADGPDLDTNPDQFALGDLDRDGFTELFVGSDDPDGAGSAVFGQAQLFYGDVAGVGRLRSTADFSYISTRGQAVPNFVGDINGDGFNDAALLDSGFGTNVIFLLY